MALNKVLGSYKPDNLFAANQELPAVTDSIEIAAGQFLKRGSLVNKDGVLVSATDTAVYAVLARDCDTTDGASEAPVYLTGEFNTDAVKVNDNVDNMFAVCVSARKAGIFLKPHAKMPPVAPMTLRFKFSKDGYNPVTAGVSTSGTWKQVLSSPNIWDWTNESTLWWNKFSNRLNDIDNEVTIIDAGDTSSVTTVSNMFYNSSSLKSVTLFDTSSVTSFGGMFKGCSALESVPLFDTSKGSTFNSMFENCSALKSIPLFDTNSATQVSLMFKNCRKVESGAKALYDNLVLRGISNANHNECFTNCGIDTPTGSAELAQIPSSWGGLGE